MITIEQIKELRDQTGISVMQCKKALEEAGGDFDQALQILKKKSLEIAAKKSDRALGAGLITLAEGPQKIAMTVLYSETDFVAKNEEFIELANKISKIAFEKGETEAQKESLQLINSLIQKIGENIKLGPIYILTGQTLAGYIHSNGKIGVLVSLSGGDQGLARDLALHIAAMKPEYQSEADIKEDEKKSIENLFAADVKDLDKPEEIKKKILDGKIKTYFKERTLLDQSYIKNPDLSIASLLEKAGGVKVLKFIRFAF